MYGTTRHCTTLWHRYPTVGQLHARSGKPSVSLLRSLICNLILLLWVTFSTLLTLSSSTFFTLHSSLPPSLPTLLLPSTSLPLSLLPYTPLAPSLHSPLLLTSLWTQGGFLVIQPSVVDFENLIKVVMTKEFKEGTGWDGSRIGWFWGGMTVQVRTVCCDHVVSVMHSVYHFSITCTSQKNFVNHLLIRMVQFYPFPFSTSTIQSVTSLLSYVPPLPLLLLLFLLSPFHTSLPIVFNPHLYLTWLLFHPFTYPRVM